VVNRSIRFLIWSPDLADLGGGFGFTKACQNDLRRAAGGSVKRSVIGRAFDKTECIGYWAAAQKQTGWEAAKLYIFESFSKVFFDNLLSLDVPAKGGA
jgi:hypothetical protein